MPYRHLLTALLVLFLSACASGPYIHGHVEAKGQSSRVRFLIMHYTVLDFSKSLTTLTEQTVSSHYLIGDKPAHIYSLVNENRMAHHAGISFWQGRTMLNDSSVGIEIVNPGYVDTPEGRVWFDYPPEQIEQVIALSRDIIKRHQIKPENVLGHSDIAPQRKSDPGPRFPWRKLAEAGIGRWPDDARVAASLPAHTAQLPDAIWFQQKLAQVGYAVPQTATLDKETRNVIAAFQMHYRPARFDGEPDAETAALIEALLPPAPVAATPAPAPAPAPAPESLPR